jgi:23S rRNA (uracil1939-C5)-methyltransferase
VIELVPEDIAHGGEAVGRLYGKAHFVAGVIPGERVQGRVVVDKGSWARVELERVLEPSPDRVEPPCPHFQACGGCQWQYADYSAQLRWKASIVAGQLAHLGGMQDPPVREAVAAGPPYGYRNRMDFRVADGRPALHRRRSKQLVPLDECSLLHPELRSLFDALGPLEGVRKLILRIGATTGERLVIVEGTVPEQAAGWGTSVAQRTRQGLRVIKGSGEIHEEIDGVTLRITGGSFFQNNTDGADRLVGLVAEALHPERIDTMLDAYAGGGLFGATVGRDAGRVLAVEASPMSLHDLRHNLAGSGVADHRVVAGAFEEEAFHLDEYWDLAVVDPPRRGLGIGGVAAVTAATPRVIAYVACDPASLARDRRHLADAGYELEWVTPVDLFPQTYHIEAVARFVRR